MLQPFYIDNKNKVTLAFEILIELVYQCNKTQSDTHSLNEAELTINKEIQLATKYPQQGSEPCKYGD
jgi:hypothetical protein